MPSLASSDENAFSNPRASASSPSPSSPVADTVLICSIAIGACVDSLRAHASDVSNSSWSGTTLLTSPSCSASYAPIGVPSRFSSSALPSPTSRGSRCVPPKPGMMPRLISGWPNVADSAAMRKSHAIDSSQPPPNAIELTDAIVTVGDFSIAVMKPCADSISFSPCERSILVNSLMSAPAENVKMFDEANTSTRSLPSTSCHSDASSSITCGESGFAGGRLSQQMPTSPRVSSAIVSRPPWSPSGCGQGKKPWPGFLPSRPCATSRRSNSGGAKFSPHSCCARSRAASTSSSPCSSARVNGPGRMPAPIIIPVSMSLSDAMPSSSTRHDSTIVLRPSRSTSVPVTSFWSVAVLIEALSGLLPEVPALDQLLHLRHHVEAIAVRVVQVLGHVEDGVEPQQVRQEERPHRDGAGLLDHLVDVLHVEALVRHGLPDLGRGRVEDPVHDEAGRLAAADRRLADLLGEVERRLHRLLRGVLALDHLDQAHHRRRVEEVEAADLVASRSRLPHLGDRERRGVRREDRVARRDLVELGEHGLLDLNPLGHRLNDEVDVAEALVIGRAGDAPEDRGGLRVGILLRDLLLLHEAGELTVRHVLGLLQARV